MSYQHQIAYWAQRIAERPIKEACFPLFVGAARLAEAKGRAKASEGGLRLGVVCEEISRDDPRGFGGFGQTVENLAQYYPRLRPDVSVWPLLPNKAHVTSTPRIEPRHGTRCLLVASLASLVTSPRAYTQALAELSPTVLLTIDYLTQYEYVLWGLPRCPVIIYLRDPRSLDEWSKIAQVPLEIEAAARGSKRELEAIAAQHYASFARVRRWSQLCGRKLVFATNAQFLVERARRKFRMPNLSPYYLPNPIPIPSSVDADDEHPKPTLLVLGRLDPQKRPWIVLELARRLPQVRFVVAGTTRLGALMKDTLDGLSRTPNVELLGMVDGNERDRLLSSCWALLNTSSHEGLPVSFQEAFAAGKPVISTQNPDGLVERFGYYAGAPSGSGLASEDLWQLVAAITTCLKDASRRHKGQRAREYAIETHSFANFDRHLRRLLEAEQLVT